MATRTAVALVVVLVAAAAGVAWLLLSPAPPAAPAPPEAPEVTEAPEPKPAETPVVVEAPSPAPEPETASEESAETPEEVQVSGTVTDAATGAPVEGAQVAALKGGSGELARLMGVEDSRGETPMEIAGTATDAQGRYAFTLEPDRDIQIICDSEGYALVRRPLPRSTGAEAQVDFRLAPGSTVMGRVIDAATGEGLKDVRVAAISHVENFMGQMAAAEAGNLRFYVGNTDENGAYKCERIEPGSYRVVPDAIVLGYIAPQGPPTVVVIDAGRDVSGIDFSLEQGAAVTVRVTDPQGNAVPLADVVLFPGQFLQAAMNMMQTQQVGSFVRSGRTGDDGLYRFAGLSFDTDYRIHGKAEGFAFTIGPVVRLARGEGQREEELRLMVGSTVSGRVHFPNNRPAADVSVTLVPNFGEIMSGMMREPQSDTSGPNGEFKIEHVPAGDYTLKAGEFNPMVMFLGGGAGTQVPVHTDGTAPVTGIDLVISEEQGAAAKAHGVIRGTVVDPAGKPVSSARVTATRSELRFDRNRGRTDTAGAFVFEELDGQTYDLSAQADSGYGEQAGVKVGANVTIKLANPTLVSGRVIDSHGQPAPDCTVTLADPSNNGGFNFMNFGQMEDVPSTQTGEDGTFAFKNVKPGSYLPKASSPAQGKGESDAITVASGARVTNVVVQLQGGARFSGDVRDSAGSPVPGALVRLSSVEEGMPVPAGLVPGFSEGGIAASTDPDGAFEFGQVPAGSYVVVASHSAYANSAPREITFSDNDVTGFHLTLPRGGSTRGRYMRDGVPVANVMIQVVGPNGMYIVTTDAEGNFDLSGVTPGRYMVQAVDINGMATGGLADATEGAPQVITVGEGEDTNVDFEPPGNVAVNGTVNGSDLGSFVTVTIRRPGGPAPEDIQPTDLNSMMDAFEYYAGYAMTNADGTFSIEGLEPGNYILEVYSADLDLRNPDFAALMEMNRTPALRQELIIEGDQPVQMDLTVPARP